MKVVTIIYYFFMVLTALSALGIVFSKNVFRSALLLLVSLLSVAAIYVLSFAEFIAVTQILIYAGGILVIIIFGIMLTTKISGRALVVHNTHIFSAALVGIALLVLLVRYLPSGVPFETTGLPAQNISVIGLVILTDHLLAFEIAGVLLLIALVGAAVVTAHLKSRV